LLTLPDTKSKKTIKTTELDNGRVIPKYSMKPSSSLDPKILGAGALFAENKG
jgi:hypothetical protein